MASNHTWLKQGCPKCGHTISSAEDEIAAYIKSLGFEIETRKRITGRTEVDIYVPSQHFAIEYDGLYWHSELMKTRGFHLKKTKTVESLGVRLFHIFEDEWLEKTEIVKSMIKNQLGITGNRIFARKCQLKEIDTPAARKFLTENHLQGYCPSGVRIGLFYNDELVAVMTFGKSRHFIGSGKYQIELLRYATKINTLVTGGASKMFKYYVRTYNPQSIVSYADRRWSDGHLYTTLGFEKYNESKPNYYYIRRHKRIYRFNMRKSILVKKFGCPPDMTEREFCYKNKYYRIYDCGCLCYCWKQ